jgi:hypothetical protein
MGLPDGSTGVYEARYTGVPSEAAPAEGGLLRLLTRVMGNNAGNVMRLEVELTTTDGTVYVWSPDLPRSGFEELRLPPEEAQPTSTFSGVSAGGSPGTLTYRVRIKGGLPENRAIAIDYAEVVPFTTSQAGTDLTVQNVEDVGDTVTRRHDAPILDVMRQYEQEYGYTSFLEEPNKLHFEPSGDEQAPVAIDYDTTPVVEASVDRDAEDIVNKVTVVGAGETQITAVDQSSVSFYGVAPREDQVVDKSLQTESEVQNRATGILEDKAWDDVAITYRVADPAFRDVRVGQAIQITWPPENITQSTWIVSSVTREEGGLVEVGVSGASEV